MQKAGRLRASSVFGPVLPVVPYRDIDDAVAHINAGPRPLALYYFGGNGEDRRKVLERTTSGNVTINDTLLHYAQDDLPFGGVGGSGMGAHHGIEGFNFLSHAKGVFEQSRWNLTGALRPPFGFMTRFVTWYLLRCSRMSAWQRDRPVALPAIRRREQAAHATCTAENRPCSRREVGARTGGWGRTEKQKT